LHAPEVDTLHILRRANNNDVGEKKKQVNKKRLPSAAEPLGTIDTFNKGSQSKKQ
jgi:hypothetical protein